jgi:phosphoglycolate phosphatase-like HAD superfamily hydrolase
VKPVVAIDIDGTLGDHYGHVVRFAEMWTGKPIKYDTDAGWPDGASKFQFHRALGVSKHTYRQIKLAYRQGGMKRSMPCFDGASELTRELRRFGAEVWICTTRPYLRLDGIDPDTRHWLRRNRIQHDGLLYGERKYHDLVRNAGRDRVALVFDDLGEMCEQAKRCGLRAVMVSQSHNERAPWAGDRANDLFEAQRVALEVIDGNESRRRVHP